MLEIGATEIDHLAAALQAIWPLLPLAEAFDTDNKETWKHWASTTLKVQNILRKIPHPPPKKLKVTATPFLSCWIAAIDARAPTGVLPAKAIWLIGRRMRYLEGESVTVRLYTPAQELDLANALRKCSTLEWVHLDEARSRIPNWPSSSPLAWKNAVLEQSRLVSGFHFSYPTTFDFLRTLRKILKRIEPSDHPLPSAPNKPALIRQMTSVLRKISVNKSLLSAADGSQFSERQHPDTDLDIVIHSSVRDTPPRDGTTRRPPFNYFRSPVSSIDVDASGLAPESRHVKPQKDTLADEPSPPQALQSLEVRYSNYRTGMDNQRLPWAWEHLNRFEIAALRDALLQSAGQHFTATPEAQGAFITWLMMSTGQGIEQILKFNLSESKSANGCLMFGPTYRRHIPTPPKAYRPSGDEPPLLNAHAECIDIQLSPPFPPLINEMGLSSNKVVSISKCQTVGDYLNLNKAEAEKAVRTFLENHRTRKFRLLPGKIRLVLNVEVMRVCNDPVATHLLTAVPSDMPPSGVYYTAYRPEVLAEIYQHALSNIFGEPL